MFNTDVNYLAVVVTAVAAMVFGFIWYSDALFGKQWMQIIGKENMSPEEKKQMQKEMGPTFVLTFIITLISAYVLAVLIESFGALTLSEGLEIGCLAWFGFGLPFSFSASMFAGKPKNLAWKMFFINASHHLVGLLIMSTILTLWI